MIRRKFDYLILKRFSNGNIISSYDLVLVLAPSTVVLFLILDFGPTGRSIAPRGLARQVLGIQIPVTLVFNDTTILNGSLSRRNFIVDSAIEIVAYYQCIG